MMTTQMERARDFIAVWVRCTSLDEVAKTTGKSKPTISAYATKLRKAGVRLPTLKAPTFERLDIAQLNSIIIKATKEK